MRSNVVLWWLLAGFFVVTGIIYSAWSIIGTPGIGEQGEGQWYEGTEWVGSTGLFFAAIMAAFIGWYLQRVYKSQGGELPEDTVTADIDDGDPEIGEFSPWSWWPIVMAFAAGVAFVGLALGSWLVPIGFGIFLVAIVGWVYEYYRGYFAH